MTPAEVGYLRTVLISLDQLTPYLGNAKRGDVATILESLCSNGQYRSLVVREAEPGRLIVLAGNHTLQALAAHGPGPCGLTIRAGGEERPCGLCHDREWTPAARCEVISCDDVTARRINLVDNRSADVGSYDDTALLDLIAGLDQDLTGTGYTDTDLSDLLAVLETPEEDLFDDTDAAEDDTSAAQGQSQPTPTPGATPPTSADPPPAVPQAPHDPAPPRPVASPAGLPGSALQPTHASPRGALVLAYPAEDRDEADRLIDAAREVLTDVDPPGIVLRALRTLAAVLDSRHDPGGTVKVGAFLRAADVDAA